MRQARLARVAVAAVARKERALPEKAMPAESAVRVEETTQAEMARTRRTLLGTGR